MSQNLLVTKFHIPPRRKNLVPRPRLVRILDEIWQPDKKMALVSASAGYGKTTLVAQWLNDFRLRNEECGLKESNPQIPNPQSTIRDPQSAIRNPSWLSLDTSDNDPAHFLAYLIAALQAIDGGIGQNTRLMLQSPQPPPPEVVLTALINEIAAAPAPFVLVLDDYHLIQSMPVHQQLDFLVEHQPLQMRLVIITREDPPLPLARLRARGQMVEIRQVDLRFTPEECSDFLQWVMGLELSAEDILSLERRTEGWIAGLQLAALSMQGRADLPGFIEAFTGSSHFVLDYLIEEVFERQPPEEQDFLLKTSILDRLCGALCDAVAARTGSAGLLDRLEHANLFIVPLDQSRTWYRYHHLFAELLHQRLHSTAAESENELHRLASQWFARHELLPEAIHHALSAADWNRAAELISIQTVMMLRQGELATLLGWLKRLPDEAITPHPHLCRDYSWALMLTGQLDAAGFYLRQAEATVRDDEALLGSILVAKAYYLRVRGDHLQAIEAAQRALSRLPASDPLSRGLAALTLGLAYMTCGSLRDAEQAFMEVDQATQLSQNHYARMTALTYLAIIQGIMGKLHRAAELCRQVIELGGQSPPVAPAYIELGALFCEWNDLESAGLHLQIGTELSQRSGNLIFLCDGFRTLAILQQACGQPQAALTTLQKARQFASGRQVTMATRMRNTACSAQLALAQNDLPKAQFWAEQLVEPADSSPLFPRLELTLVRLLIAQNKKTEAADMLNELYDIACQADWGAGMIEVRTLQALAAAGPAEGLQFLREALQKAQPEGFIRTFVDKGQPMKLLLERLKSEGGELKDYILTILLAFGEKCTAPVPQPLVEPLSERELEVLKLLAGGLANREIAERLVVSVGTVKTHVHSIIGKLGVSSRMQAVARAKELNLL